MHNKYIMSVYCTLCSAVSTFSIRKHAHKKYPVNGIGFNLFPVQYVYIF